jgi:hypothetical protein
MMGGRAALGSGAGTTESGAVLCECLDAREDVRLHELDDLTGRHRRALRRREANRELPLRRRLGECATAASAAYYSLVWQIVSDNRRAL